MAAKKVVLRVDLHDNKDKQKVLKAVSTLPGIDSISVDMKTQNLTVIGLADPVDVVARLRKAGNSTAIVSVGPAKEEKKDDKKDDKKKEDEKKKEDDKKQAIVYPPWLAPQYQYPYYPQYLVHSAEEDPNSCVIC